MEIACVIDSRLATPARPGLSGGPGPGRAIPDPVAAAEATEAMVCALEGIGAAVESERAGEAFFAIDGLRGLYGGIEGVLTTAREAVAAAGGGGAEVPAGVAAGPTRLAAFVAATGWRRPVPVAALRHRLGVADEEAGELIEALRRLGIVTLPRLARLSPDQVADRFGELGLRALRLARGGDDPLRPRVPHEELTARVELPEGTAGRQLERALELLVDRLLAAPRRRGRTLLGLRLGALLCGGGSWSVDQGLGRPTASARTLRGLLLPRLGALPGPAEALRLRALGLGPPVGDQLELAVGGAAPRRRRLAAALREVRAAQGPEALLRVLPVDPDSRVPERWAMLTPMPVP